VRYSEKDKVWHGKILCIPDLLTYEADTMKELQQDFKETVDAYLGFDQEQ